VRELVDTLSCNSCVEAVAIMVNPGNMEGSLPELFLMSALEESRNCGMPTAARK